MRVGRSALVASLLVSALAVSGATPDQIATFRASVEAVRLDVSVTRGRTPVAGLTANDFEVRDCNVRQRVMLLAAERLPVDAVLVLDTSLSVNGEPLSWLRQAGGRFLDQLRTGDRAALVSFSQVVQVLSPLAGDLRSVKTALGRLRAGGGTALYDAAFAGMRLTEGLGARTLVLVLSDGADNFSWLDKEALFDAARASDVVVYTTSTWRRPSASGPRARRTLAAFGLSAEERVLSELAEITGGELYPAAWDAGLAGIFEEVVRNFRARYVLSYQPEGVPSKGWHPITVRVRGDVQVRARSGYYK